MSDGPGRILSGTLLLIYTIFVLSGIVCVGASLACFYYEKLFLSGVFANIGCSIIASAFVLYLIQRFTDQINHEIQKANNAEFETVVSRRTNALDARLANLTALSNKELARLDSISDHVIEREFRQSASQAGIERASSSDAGGVDDDFLRSGNNLIVKMKDGKSFFPRKVRVIEERVRGNLKTTVVILHPDSEDIAAVAGMDDTKRGKPRLQRQECEEAIAEMHKLRDRLSQDSINAEELIDFIGYRFVPTWVGFIGDEIAYVHLYFTAPYRGSLNTLCLAKGEATSTKNWYWSYVRDVDETIRHAKELSDWNLWNYHR
jgi:hypothetical protein